MMAHCDFLDFCQAHRHSMIRLLIASLLMDILVITPTQAEIIADPSAPRDQQAVVLQTANGLPLVNIQTPSAAGVSHNTYQQFDINAQGAILNNSPQSVASQLGGWIPANPHLLTGGARLILNEVNSSHPSQLSGFIEIAGNRAELVIANPAGIYCNGCGFINASQVSLSTGRPLMQGGDLAAYRVGGGNISITGRGMDASQVNYTQVIARAVAINAGLWAQHLKITTGLNQVGRNGEIQRRDIAATGTNPAPQFALDVAELGGMYARKIHLIGTEVGVGVRNNGHIGASAGELLVMADGRLLNSGQLSSQGRMEITSRAGISNSGSLLSQADIQLSTSADISHSGSLLAQGNVSLQASGAASRITLQRDALVAAGLENAFSNAPLSLGNHGQLNISASNIEAHGQQFSGAGQRYLGQQLDLQGSQINARQLNLLSSAGNINLMESNLAIAGTLTANTGFTLDTSRSVVTAQRLDLHAAQLDNTAGSLTQSGTDDMQITLTHGLDNAQGRIHAQGNLSIESLTLNNQQGRITAAQSLSLRSQGNIDNRQQGQIRANGALNLTSEQLLNQQGILAAGEGMQLTNSDRIENNAGQIIANQRLDIRASQINNQKGTIGSVTETASLIASTGKLDNFAGRIEAGGLLTLDAQGINNQQGTLVGRSLNVDAHGEELDNQHGQMLAAGNASNDSFTLNASKLSNQNGEINGRQSLQLNTAQLDNRQGAIRAAGDLTLQNAGDLVQGGEITSQGKLTLRATSLDNQLGAIIAGQDTVLDIVDLLSNRGSIDGENTIISARNINNLGTGLILGNHLALQADTLRNTAESVNGSRTGAAIAARERLDIGVRTLSNEDGSLIFSGGKLAIGRQLDSEHQAMGKAENIDNISANIEAQDDMRIEAARLMNQRRNLEMQRVKVSTTSGYRAECIDLRKCSYIAHINATTTTYEDLLTSTSAQAVILSAANAQFIIDNLINQYSSIEAGGNLEINATQLTNQGAQRYRQTDIFTSKQIIHWGMAT